jgi:hypothetical protein
MLPAMAKTRDGKMAEDVSVAANTINDAAALLSQTAERISGSDEILADKLWNAARNARRLRTALEKLTFDKGEKNGDGTF